MKRLYFFTALIIPLLTIAQKSIPESFMHLKPIVANEDYSAFIFANESVDTNVSFYNIEGDDFEFDTPICLLKMNTADNEVYLISFSEGPSADPAFEIYKKENNRLKHLFRLAGTKLYVPGNGFLYTSGIENNFYDEKKKFKFQHDELEEVKQPIYYVGKETKTLKTIQLYIDTAQSQLVATIPANATIELVAAQRSLDYDAYYFLIKTSFGLLGWWRLDDYYSESINDLYFHGD